jgi:hypothetical protein
MNLSLVEDCLSRYIRERKAYPQHTLKGERRLVADTDVLGSFLDEAGPDFGKGGVIMSGGGRSWCIGRWGVQGTAEKCTAIISCGFATVEVDLQRQGRAYVVVGEGGVMY